MLLSIDKSVCYYAYADEIILSKISKSADPIRESLQMALTNTSDALTTRNFKI